MSAFVELAYACRHWHAIMYVVGSITTQPIELPLSANADGVILIGSTRVSLDTLVHAFKSGASAEQIADQYPSLALGDVYLVIAHYLRDTDPVERYLASRSMARGAVREEAQRRFDLQGIRDRLLARRRKSNTP